jgi:hypothetical protein
MARCFNKWRQHSSSGPTGFASNSAALEQRHFGAALRQAPCAGQANHAATNYRHIALHTTSV